MDSEAQLTHTHQADCANASRQPHWLLPSWKTLFSSLGFAMQTPSSLPPPPTQGLSQVKGGLQGSSWLEILGLLLGATQLAWNSASPSAWHVQLCMQRGGWGTWGQGLPTTTTTAARIPKIEAGLKPLQKDLCNPSRRIPLKGAPPTHQAAPPPRKTSPLTMARLEDHESLEKPAPPPSHPLPSMQRVLRQANGSAHALFAPEA